MLGTMSDKPENLIRARALPECPPGMNPFKWIVANAPKVRQQRQGDHRQAVRKVNEGAGVPGYGRSH